jgi:hypothetical protein
LPAAALSVGPPRHARPEAVHRFCSIRSSHSPVRGVPHAGARAGVHVEGLDDGALAPAGCVVACLAAPSSCLACRRLLSLRARPAPGGGAGLARRPRRRGEADPCARRAVVLMLTQQLGPWGAVVLHRRDGAAPPGGPCPQPPPPPRARRTLRSGGSPGRCHLLLPAAPEQRRDRGTRAQRHACLCVGAGDDVCHQLQRRAEAKK